MKYYLKEKLRFFVNEGDLMDEEKNVVYRYDNRTKFSPKINLYRNDEKIACVQSEFSLFYARYAMYYRDKEVGKLEQRFNKTEPEFLIQGLGWRVKGDMNAMKYDIFDEKGELLVNVSQQPFDQILRMCIDIKDEEREELILTCVMAVYQYQKQRQAAVAYAGA